MCAFNKTYSKILTKQALLKLAKANEYNTARASIAEHRAEGLKEALQIEKKKRQRGKKLNLSGKEAGGAQFFGVPEVMAAKQREDEKEAKATQEKLEKEKAKEEKAVAKAVKEALAKQEKLRKVEQKEINTQVKKERKKREGLDQAEARRAAAAAKKEATAAIKAAKKAKSTRITILRTGSTILASLGSQEEVVVEEPVTEEVIVPQTTKSGRQIILPQRLRE